MAATNQRNYKYDNIKAFLIFCVVLGHLLERVSLDTKNYMFILIYSFHMPVFCFLSGMYAKYRPKEILTKLLYPYIVFQIIYIMFSKVIFSSGRAIQFSVPYWIIWYLLAITIFYTLIPFFDTENKKKKVWIIAITISLALLAGYDSSIGYTLSLSRVIVMIPFFIAGFYFKKLELFDKVNLDNGKNIKHIKLIRIATITIAIGSALIMYILRDDIIQEWLFAASSYAKDEYNALIRLAFMSTAAIFTILLVLMSPNKKIPIISKVGSNTLPIYLLHGLAVRFLLTNDFIKKLMSTRIHIWVIILFLAVAMVLIFSAKPVRYLVSPLMSFPKGHIKYKDFT